MLLLLPASPPPAAWWHAHAGLRLPSWHRSVLFCIHSCFLLQRWARMSARRATCGARLSWPGTTPPRCAGIFSLFCFHGGHPTHGCSSASAAPAACARPPPVRRLAAGVQHLWPVAVLFPPQADGHEELGKLYQKQKDYRRATAEYRVRRRQLAAVGLGPRRLKEAGPCLCPPAPAQPCLAAAAPRGTTCCPLPPTPAPLTPAAGGAGAGAGRAQCRAAGLAGALPGVAGRPAGKPGLLAGGCCGLVCEGAWFSSGAACQHPSNLLPQAQRQSDQPPRFFPLKISISHRDVPLQEGIASYEAALQLAPQAKDLWLNLGMALKEICWVDRAREVRS